MAHTVQLLRHDAYCSKDTRSTCDVLIIKNTDEKHSSLVLSDGYIYGVQTPPTLTQDPPLKRFVYLV